MALTHLAPEREAPWDARAAAHLLRRAGFGASRAEIDRAVEQGLEGAVKDLFDDGKEQEAQFQETFRRLSGSFVDFSDIGQLQAWWCYRMLTTRTPLREKLTLFWHGHFATSVHKVEDVFLMHQQCETLRRLAWGNFRDLVLAVSRDPAMLVYLDGESSTKDNPNENFARELLELFTLGVGNYTEKDVREAARAFTGWHRDNTKFTLNAAAHDDGDKEVLGRKGKLDGRDVLDTVLAHPALPRFLARKLLVFFACPEPPPEVVEEAADVFQAGQFSVKRFLTALFQSKFFCAEKCRRTRISSPAECVIGACRSFGVRLAAQECRDHVTAMGQELFGPPNVKGWDGERKWIHAGTWAARQAFGQRVGEVVSGNDFGPHLDAFALVPAEVTDPKKVAELLAERVLEGTLSKKTRAEIAEYLVAADEGPKPDDFRDNGDFRAQKVREAVGLLLSLPDYHAY
ncbi:MAG TPA: DUF1800 domain-containing protein [Gemmataceae bacterium]|nr:DUF1800 domain-containing protein [Gemmataceae bacterium]